MGASSLCIWDVGEASVSLGRCLVGNLDDVAEVLAAAEDEACQ